jgi:IS4 transposase
VDDTTKPQDASVTILADKVCKLKNRKNEWTNHSYRVIDGIIDKSQEPISWITNALDLDAYEIAYIYKQRWEIEVFFKFLKQHLNLKHLVSRTENGIKVMLYITLILAILLIVYKKKNKIKGYKIAKLNFEIELDNELTKEIVILCGGNPNKAKYLWNTS